MPEPRCKAVSPERTVRGISTRMFASMSTNPRAAVQPQALPQLWKAFALCWSVVHVIVLYLLPKFVEPGARRTLAFAGLLLLAAAYLQLTLRAALTFGAREQRAHTRRALLQLVGMLTLVVALCRLVPTMGMWWLAQHVVVAAGLALTPRMAAAAIALIVTSSLALAAADTGEFQPMLLIQLSFGAAAMAIRQLTLTVIELRAARAQVARMAVAEERKRFSRDLHDLLGHSLSAIVLKTELAQRMFAGSPERSVRELHEIERTAREALQRVRAAVAGYHQPTLAQELSAAAELLEAAGITVRVDNRVSDLPASLDALLAWTVREAVTNVFRHSRARSCTIRVGQPEGCVRLEVLDDGAGSDASVSGGTGLTGLSERASAAGGKLWTERTSSGGFALRVDVPSAELSR
jgi:two-component system sensor histidine kinase DesK